MGAVPYGFYPRSVDIAGAIHESTKNEKAADCQSNRLRKYLFEADVLNFEVKREQILGNQIGQFLRFRHIFKSGQ